MAVTLERNTGNLMEGEAIILSVPKKKKEEKKRKERKNTDMTNIVRCAYAAQHSNY
jgi:hypothetical protein